MTDTVPSHRTRPVLTIIAAIIAVPLLVIALYTAAALHVDYSSGQRAGILQKFSRKGWVCKTWEGELAMTTVPGVAPTLWEFSTRDAAVAANVEAAVGKRVVLHYREHRGLPTRCFGETGYFVDSMAIATP